MKFDGAFFPGHRKDGVSPKSAGITCPLGLLTKRSPPEIACIFGIWDRTLSGVQQLTQVPSGQRNLEDRSSFRARARGEPAIVGFDERSANR